MEITHGGNLFEVARNSGWDWREVVDLSASVNPPGPAPGARRAIIEAVERAGHYPDETPRQFIEQLAKRWRVEPSQVLPGNGAAEIQLWCLGRTILIGNCSGWPGIEGDAIRIAIDRCDMNERVVEMPRRYIMGS